MADISRAKLRQAFPRAKQPDAWADALDAEAKRVGISTPRRICHFLAQLAHEFERLHDLRGESQLQDCGPARRGLVARPRNGGARR